MYKNEERYAVRCRECGQVLAVRDGNMIESVMKHRNRKKELHVKLFAGQKMTILCDKCGVINEIIGS